MADEVEGSDCEHFVCLFAQEHVDFRISVSTKINRKFNYCKKVQIFLWSTVQVVERQLIAANSSNTVSCILFVHLFQELLSISSMFGFNVRFQSKDHRKEVKLTLILLLLCTRKSSMLNFITFLKSFNFAQNPHLLIRLPNKECARHLLSRAVTIK